MVDAFFAGGIEGFVGADVVGFCGEDGVADMDHWGKGFWSGLEVEECGFTGDECLFDGGVLAVVVGVLHYGVGEGGRGEDLENRLVAFGGAESESLEFVVFTVEDSFFDFVDEGGT